MKLKTTLKIAFVMTLLILLSLLIMTCGPEKPAVETPAAEIPAPELPVMPSPTPPPAPSPEITVTPSEEPSPDPEPEPEPKKPPIKAWPIWMYIPALGVDAEIKDTGTDFTADTMIIAPGGSVISWWRGSSIPGNEGNAIFGGHNRWKGELGQLFALDTLEIGDEMVIEYDDDTSLTFRLESVFVYLLATAPAAQIMDTSGDARVTLITCKDPFNPNTGTSDNRIIAVFKEESVFEIPDPPITPLPLRETTQDS